MQVVFEKQDLKQILLEHKDVFEEVIRELTENKTEYTLKEICQLTGLKYSTVTGRKIQLHPSVVELRSTMTKSHLYKKEAIQIIKDLFNAGYVG